ncbi:MAG: DUF3575 domain-containing protein [Flavobacteriaceae bacterium]|nr:DUF3575 domain-containing protein [Flavobacteriaceae bacterium]
MKKTLLLLSFLFPFMLLQAQEKEVFDYKNNIQFNPIDAVLFGSFELKYERAISEKSTILLGVGLKPSAGLLKIKGFDSPRMKTDDFGFTGFAITPEYRWYFQKNTKTKRTGLYVGGYYRFKNHSNAFKGTYTSGTTGTSSPIDADLGMKTHTIGAVFGYKVMLGEHFYCDILIAGPGYTSAKVNITENKPLPDEFYIDAGTVVLENFDSVVGLVKHIDVEKVRKVLEGNGSIGLPAFRYGFKIGYSF